MADTAYGVNHPLAQKLWSAKLFHDVIGNSYVGKFVGTSDTSLIQLKNETKKDAGDRIRVGLRTLLTGDGIQGDATLEGNEEALTTYFDDILINQLRHAVRSDGKMSEQRVPFSVREEIRMGLEDWWTERLEVSAANQMTGNTGQSNTVYTGNQATVAPTRFVVGGNHATEASLSATTTHAIKLSDIDRAVALAKEPSTAGQPRIRPINIDGKRYWVAFLHPYAINQLRQDASTAGNFFDIQKAQLQGGKISDNPILTGGEFIHNGVIVHEWNYLPTIAGTPNSGTASQFRRGAICGAQALCMAVGQGGSPNKMTWDEETFDYGNKMGVAAGMIFGMKKTVFNSTDFGVITLSGFAPNP
jgi:N4-gp56 family major capsid protein